MTRLPPQWLLLRLDRQASPAAQRGLLTWLESVLPHLDWRCHLVLAGGGPEQALAVAGVAAAYADRHPFVTVRLQPCLDDDPLLERELLALARRFQSRAYREQTELGLELLPVLTPAPGTTPERLVDRIIQLRARLAEPRLVLEERSAGEFEAALAADNLGDLRRDVLPTGAGGPGAVLAMVGAGLVVETAVERLAGNPADALEPCCPHVVVDQVQGLAFPCVRAFTLGLPAAPMGLADEDGPPDLEPPAELCPECFADSTLAAAPGLAASGRRNEATAAALRVAVALAGRDAHRAGASCAACAAGLAGSHEERAGALLLEGLCCQRAGDLETAVERLQQGLATGIAAGERPRVLRHLAGCLEQLGRADEAAAVAAEAAALVR